MREVIKQILIIIDAQHWYRVHPSVEVNTICRRNYWRQ